MNQTKIKVDALPCQNSSFRVWFWLMIACGIISMTLAFFKEVTSTPSRLVNILMLLLSIPGYMFSYIFAKACRSVSETLYKYWLGSLFLSFSPAILMAIVGDQENMAVNLIAGIIWLVLLVLCIMIAHLLVKNYTGLLGDLGRYIYKMLGICVVYFVGIVFFTIILISQSIDSSGLTIGLIIGSVILFIVSLGFYFVKFLSVSYRLLNNGLCLSSDNGAPEETVQEGEDESESAEAFVEKKRSFSLRPICNAVSSKIAEHSRIVWIVVSVIIIACLVIVIAKYSSQSRADNVKMYQTYKEVEKDASQNRDPKLTPFFENEDIIGVAIDKDGFVNYFSQTEYNEDYTRTNTIDELPVDSYNIINRGVWNINNGALVYYSGEGTSFISIIDGYSFYGNYYYGLCWNEEFDSVTESMGDIGYAPTKATGEKLKKFLWKGYAGTFWAHLAPETEAKRMVESTIKAIPNITPGVNDITYRHGKDGRFHARNIADGDSQTAWVIGDKEFEEFEIETEGHFPRMIYMRPAERTPIRQIGILNGSYSYDENEISWENYGRVRNITIMGCYDDTHLADNLYSGTLPDETGWQIIDLTKHAAYDYYSFIIDDYYPGKVTNDIAISEIVFYQ